MELGESLREAVRREVREEVGLDVVVQDLVVALDRVLFDDAGRIEYHYVLLDFLCRPAEGEPCPASDVMDCTFVAIDALEQYAMTVGTAQVIHRAFRQMQGVHFPVYDADL